MPSSRSVEAELIGLLYRHVPAVLAANVVNSSLMVAVLWHSADRLVLLGWALAIMALALGRVVLLYCYRRQSDDGEVAVRWRPYYTVGTVASGLLWGSTAPLFVRHEDPISLILVSFVIGGMAAGAVTSLSPHLPAFYLYLLCSVLPLEARMLADGGRVPLAMSGMVTVFVVSLVIIARNFNAALIRALTLNEQNQFLLANLEGEVDARTAELQTTNARLETEVAERKNAEAGLKEARAEAEQANRAKSRFLAAASHDLRQPLQAMFLFAETVHRHVAGQRGVDALVQLERGLDTLKGMLDSLLDISRLDVNVLTPEIKTFPLGPMLNDLLLSYRQVAASKGIALTSGTLSDAAVRSDPNLLGRMVRNLMENAIRYTERGHVTLSATRSGGVVRVEVADTGIGIAPDQIKKIFEEFHQVANPERDKAHGLGLGLAIVQRLSNLLGHPVTVQSQFGKGSTFTIEVPAAAEVAAGASPDRSTLTMAEPDAAGHGMGRQVVMIDDDPMVLLALSGIFEQWGYRVVMADSSDEATEKLRASVTAPNLIIADYRLRNGRVGTEAIRSIRATFGLPVPSIVLTGETGSECEDEAKALGAAIIHKPVTPRQLAFALKALLGEAPLAD